MALSTPSALVRTEAAALLALADRLEGLMAEPFERAVTLLLQCGHARGRVVLTGMGKSGIIAQKLAATLSSTGSPALFLHPAEAVHGDIGMLAPGDVILALSASGETEELLRLLATVQRIGDALIVFCCNLGSTLARAADVALDCSVQNEACGLGLAPTASTTAMLALGDALAIAVSLRKGFRAEDFARLHPGGRLGKRLAPVSELMHTGDRIPRVQLHTPMSEVIYEMTRKGLGMTVVLDPRGRLAGVISDGDLRRLLVAHGGDALALTAAALMRPGHLPAGEEAAAASRTGHPDADPGRDREMEKDKGEEKVKEKEGGNGDSEGEKGRDTGKGDQTGPHTIQADELAARALARMEAHRITSLVVLTPEGDLAGVLHLHALWGLELI